MHVDREFNVLVAEEDPDDPLLLGSNFALAVITARPRFAIEGNEI